MDNQPRNYVPFSNFEGRETYHEEGNKRIGSTIFHHFNQAIGRLLFSPKGIKGEIFDGKQWIMDNPEAQRSPHQTIQTFSDFWGIRNFAKARLLNKDQLEKLTNYQPHEMEEALLYLELRHTPSLSYPPPLLSDRYGVFVKGYTTVIPLQEHHLKKLMQNMYTCRFVVKNGKATSYRLEGEKISSGSPSFSLVPNGTYEFYYGKAVKVGWGGITSALPSDDPLYHFDPENVQKLFNVGIEMTNQVAPYSQNQPLFPNRYAYFREGALMVLGGILMEKDDPLLISFHKREELKAQVSTKHDPYAAFKDYGPPLTPDGKLDKSFIETFGFKLPDKHYLALGDNHAMSQDSRYFGPIPQANLQGAPSLIIWPPGSRWGIPNQKPYPLLTLPRLIVWGLAGLIVLFAYLLHRRNLKKSIFKKLG